MQVETFECHETAAEPIESCEEATALIEKLGLAGQKKLAAKNEHGRDVRCPYREMTHDEAWVYKVLCPDEQPVTDYERSPMPLRVLQVAAHAQSLGMFFEVVVWDRKSAAIKDPVLVGVVKSSKYSSDVKLFILARWGEELEAFVTLVKRAVTAKREAIAQKLKAIAAEVSADLAMLESRTDDDLMAKPATSMPTYYG